MPCLEEDDHITKVLEFDYILEDGDVKEFVKLFGCTKCDATSPTVWAGFGKFKSNSKRHDILDANCDCFGCKAATLQMNTGDAKRDVSDKKWTGELQAYRDARAEGIQPAGTTHRHIEEARKASEVLNKAYDANTMPRAKDINKRSAEVLKETGAI
jgi:inhibitor of KinA sporulation pathway (predicted exonuclease)